MPAPVYIWSDLVTDCAVCGAVNVRHASTTDGVTVSYMPVEHVRPDGAGCPHAVTTPEPPPVLNPYPIDTTPPDPPEGGG